NDAIIVKFEPTKLNVVWSRVSGAVNAGDFASGLSLALDSGDNVYAVGLISKDTAFLARISPVGLVTGVKFIGGRNNAGTQALAKDVTVDGSGNAYVVGTIKGGAINFNPGGSTVALDSAGNTTDAFVARFDPNLTASWANRFGSALTDR